jgi:rhodanese-related sulfurtransferase
LTLSSALGLGVNYARGLPLHPFQPYVQTYTAPTLDAPAAYALKDSAIFIDPRPIRTYHNAHIVGAINLHKDDPRVASFSHEKTIIVYCDILCPLAHQTAATLHDKGFTKIYVLGGGLTAWSNQAYPVVQGFEQ